MIKTTETLPKPETISTATSTLAGLEGVRRRPLLKSFGKLIRREPVGFIALVVILLLIGTALFAQVLAPYDPLKQSYRPGDLRAAPGSSHWFGSDQYGRDTLSRVIFGTRVSLLVGFFAVLFGVLIGSVFGLLAGYLGGRFDFVMQVGGDILQAFPALILAMALVSVLGYNAVNITIAITVVLIPTTYRVVRGATLAIRSNQYIEASRAIGCRSSRIILQHILPNVLPIIIIQASTAVGIAILAEGALSFLGLGTQPPQPTWGNMLNEGRAEYERAPWLAVFPGLAISLTVLAFNLFGDAMRDLLDPAQKKR